jgi:hypothetical protein
MVGLESLSIFAMKSGMKPMRGDNFSPVHTCSRSFSSTNFHRCCLCFHFVFLFHYRSDKEIFIVERGSKPAHAPCLHLLSSCLPCSGSLDFAMRARKRRQITRTGWRNVNGGKAYFTSEGLEIDLIIRADATLFPVIFHIPSPAYHSLCVCVIVPKIRWKSWSSPRGMCVLVGERTSKWSRWKMKNHVFRFCIRCASVSVVICVSFFRLRGPKNLHFPKLLSARLYRAKNKKLS